MDHNTDTYLLLSLTRDLLQSELCYLHQKVLLTFSVFESPRFWKDFKMLLDISLASEISLEVGRILLKSNAIS